jgi:4a-hydroxytetrahydrobiopterin dehydratase
MPRLLESKEIKEALKDLPEWEQEGKTIERTLEFDDFSQAMDFVNGVAELAEDAEHHPDIDIRFNKVRLILTTHSKGGLTDSDVDLAEKIDTLVDD